MVTVYGYSKCSTVRKSLAFLEANTVKFKHIDNVKVPLSVEELTEIFNKLNQDKKKLFNTSGLKYRELGLKDKVDSMSIEEAMEVLSTDGMLVKRPILINGNNVLVGFKIKEWEEVFS